MCQVDDVYYHVPNRLRLHVDALVFRKYSGAVTGALAHCARKRMQQQGGGHATVCTAWRFPKMKSMQILQSSCTRECPRARRCRRNQYYAEMLTPHAVPRGAAECGSFNRSGSAGKGGFLLKIPRGDIIGVGEDEVTVTSGLRAQAERTNKQTNKQTGERGLHRNFGATLCGAAFRLAQPLRFL